ncbi:hypothetical protein AERO9A_110054 [Aeromonas salmonicida]|nr:hypothetical protein AERO9A_110054 [Aeromonas salmonicida]
MRLGILDCDRLDPDLADHFGPVYSEMFIKGFRALAPELEFRIWSALDGELPDDLQECDAWLITGSRHDAYSDLPWIQALRAWIRLAHDADVKLAGVCFGHQVIAQALGGEVVKSTKGWGGAGRCVKGTGGGAGGLGSPHAGDRILDAARAGSDPDPGQPSGSGGPVATRCDPAGWQRFLSQLHVLAGGPHSRHSGASGVFGGVQPGADRAAAGLLVR